MPPGHRALTGPRQRPRHSSQAGSFRCWPQAAARCAVGAGSGPPAPSMRGAATCPETHAATLGLSPPGAAQVPEARADPKHRLTPSASVQSVLCPAPPRWPTLLCGALCPPPAIPRWDLLCPGSTSTSPLSRVAGGLFLFRWMSLLLLAWLQRTRACLLHSHPPAPGVMALPGRPCAHCPLHGAPDNFEHSYTDTGLQQGSSFPGPCVKSSRTVVVNLSPRLMTGRER